MTATKPRALPVVPDGIPAELRACPRWVAWDYEERQGEWTKVPLDAGKHFRHRASATDPRTWMDFDTAYAYAETRGTAGVGYVLTADDPYCGVDLDGCRDPETGALTEAAAAIVAELSTYAEVSPGGRGVKLWLKARLPTDRGRKRPDLGIEVYDRARWFAATGRRLATSPREPRDRQAALDALYARLWPAEDATKANGNDRHTGGVPPDDLAIIARAERARNGTRFAALWRGDVAGNHDDDSGADLALCNLLAFWVGPDPHRIDRLFRASGLYRAKWERGDYRRRTIEKALAGRTAYYDWRRDDGDDGAAFRAEDDEDETPPANGWPADIYPYTDLANAHRLIARHGADIRYCERWKRFLTWEGTHWADDATLGVLRRAQDTARALYAEAAAETDPERAKALAKWAIRSQSAERIRAMVDVAKADARIAVTPAELDTDPWALNCANGTLDLRTLELRPHLRGDLLTKIAGASYEPDASAPAWAAFLDRIFAGQADVLAFVRRAAGYALTGSIRERALFILHGHRGHNGKTTWIETIAHALGDYARSTPVETFLARRENPIPNDVARLAGVRYVYTSETDEGKRLAEAKIKQLTGGDTISARFLNAEFFDFTPICKIFLATNHKPQIRGTDQAIWDRIRLVPFEVRIPDDEVDRTLRERLDRELAGVLAWCVEGCREWLADGLGTPAAVDAATAAYRAEQDVLGTWLDESCDIGPAFSTSAAALYESYTAWCKQAGEEPMSQRALALRMLERGFEQHRGHGGKRRWRGLNVRGKDTYAS